MESLVDKVYSLLADVKTLDVKVIKNIVRTLRSSATADEALAVLRETVARWQLKTKGVVPFELEASFEGIVHGAFSVDVAPLGGVDCMSQFYSLFCRSVKEVLVKDLSGAIVAASEEAVDLVKAVASEAVAVVSDAAVVASEAVVEAAVVASEAVVEAAVVASEAVAEAAVVASEAVAEAAVAAPPVAVVASVAAPPVVVVASGAAVASVAAVASGAAVASAAAVASDAAVAVAVVASDAAAGSVVYQNPIVARDVSQSDRARKYYARKVGKFVD